MSVPLRRLVAEAARISNTGDTDMYHFTHTLERDEDIDVEVTFEVHRGRITLTEVTHDGADLGTTGDEDAALSKAAWRVYDDQRWDHAL